MSEREHSDGQRGRWGFNGGGGSSYAGGPAGGAREAPRETGERLCTVARPGRGGKPDEELRVSLDEYEGHRYLSLRVWTRGQDGDGGEPVWFPTKRGVTVRARELLEVARAVVGAARRLGVLESKGGGGDGESAPPATAA